MTNDAIELPIMHWVWLTALSGIISNIGWELFNYFGHATMHSVASAWHEFKNLPSHIFSLHAPLRLAGVVLAALAVISLAQSTGDFVLVAALSQLIDFYRGFVHAIGDQVFALVIDPLTRGIAYDLVVVALIFVFVIWRTATGWHNYADFQHGHGNDGLSLGAYFGLQLVGALGAVAIALAIIDRLT